MDFSPPSIHGLACKKVVPVLAITVTCPIMQSIQQYYLPDCIVIITQFSKYKRYLNTRGVVCMIYFHKLYLNLQDGFKTSWLLWVKTSHILTLSIQGMENLSNKYKVSRSLGFCHQVISMVLPTQVFLLKSFDNLLILNAEYWHKKHISMG